jgi:hypothetical protein
VRDWSCSGTPTSRRRWSTRTRAVEVFVRLRVASELVEQHGEIIQVTRAVPLMPRLLVMVDGGGELDDGPVRVVRPPLRRGESPENQSLLPVPPSFQCVTGGPEFGFRFFQNAQSFVIPITTDFDQRSPDKDFRLYRASAGMSSRTRPWRSRVRGGLARAFGGLREVSAKPIPFDISGATRWLQIISPRGHLKCCRRTPSSIRLPSKARP